MQKARLSEQIHIAEEECAQVRVKATALKKEIKQLAGPKTAEEFELDSDVQEVAEVGTDGTESEEVEDEKEDQGDGEEQKVDYKDFMLAD